MSQCATLEEMDRSEMIFMHLQCVSTKQQWQNLAYQVLNIYQSVILGMDNLF